MHQTNSKTFDQITMKCLHILLSTCCLISSGLAKPTSVLSYQDSLGQYSFGYSAPNSARAEVRKLNGETQGAYSYVDDAGVIQSAQYTADGKNVFRVAATNLPEAPLPLKDIQEVVESGRADFQEQVAKVLGSSIDGETKIGANNVFLKELRIGEKGTVESEEKIPIQAKEENIEKIETKNLKETEPQSAGEVIKIGEKENSDGNLKTIIEESQAKLVQDDPAATADNPALGTTLRSNQEELKEIKQIDTKESAALGKKQSGSEEKDKIDPSQEIIAPISILPLNTVYPTLLRYASLPSLPYYIYNIP